MTDVIIAIFLLLMTLISVLLFFLAERLQRLLDRYRLKYGFDRDIEEKEMSGKEEDKPEKLNRRERYFKRRVYKD